MSKLIIHPAIRDVNGGPISGQHFHWPERVPSWKKFGKGHGHLCVQGHRQVGWVSITASETSAESAKGRTTTKEVMLTLDRPAAEALRDYLNHVLGGSSREARTLLGYPSINSIAGELRGTPGTSRDDGRLFAPRPVTRADAGGQLFAPVDQNGVESGDTPSHDCSLVQTRCDELNAGRT